MRHRWDLTCIAGVLACIVYLVSAGLAYSRYPLAFSPSTHWLSDLGDRAVSVVGAPYYNAGILITGPLVFLWFVGLSRWRVPGNRRQRWYLLISQAAGALGALAILMSAIFPIDMLAQHAFWSRVHYMMLAMGFGFSVAALAVHPTFPRPLLYLGTLAAFSPLATWIAGDTYWLEWISVGLFLAYVLSVGLAQGRRGEPS